ncbi:DEAD/DEAH box helicase [Arcticibacterium luteifluviistationis]|uniref:DEAD/DEAH box helicase n=1 Tax=Arcticibacterium luteifluviistationis TaxID=1784714 RepID=A0A2Z4GFY7_9BACT|nr:DEAD/DEAH box helicase [Arcticibacterium luteifluviistationis]AWV99693.1 DEAD/DEAH box helicase [Arcticibacterium luteifluviistationis]
MPVSFSDFALNKQLLTAIEELGYKEPTPIQEQAIPTLLYGHDVLGIAQTGTGKTAAYLLPILMKIKYAQGNNIRCVILAPTRELAIQINDAIADFGKYTDLRHTAVYGGLGPKTQIEAIQAGLDIIVATPGRFMDLYLRGIIVTKDIKYMVLDEADKMMDMGFMPQIRKILEVIPRKRKNLLFSATFPEKIEKFSQEFLEAPVRIEVTPQATAAKTIDQRVYAAPNFQTKLNLLGHLFKDQDDIKRALVFCRTKTVADLVFKFLDRKIVGRENVRVIHANKGQNTRINSINAFKGGELRVLVATDVAARGIDVQAVSHVINFDVPVIYEDYVHRIGRTGRANLDGVAITFMTPNEEYHLERIEEIIRAKIPVLNIPSDIDIVETPFEEQQIILREIDEQKKKKDPTFQGAFHEKKKKNLPRETKKKRPFKKRRH